MSVIDILTRVDVLCKKYEKYDLDKQREADSLSGQDQFVKLFTVIEADIEATLQVLSPFLLVAACVFIKLESEISREDAYGTCGKKFLL